MKLLLLSDINSAHTIKWAISLSQRGIDVTVFSFSKMRVEDYNGSAVKVVTYDLDVGKYTPWKRLAYIRVLPFVRRLIRSMQADIVHAHYATSYALVGALTQFRPFVISVWGSDVFEFPNLSFLHKKLLKYNLSKANRILSTSYVMARETEKYTSKNVVVTPFGIDLDVFKKEQSKRVLFPHDTIVIGTIKCFEPVYGIDYLIDAFALLCDKHPQMSLRLLLVGDGTSLSVSKEKVAAMGLQAKVVFVGEVSFSEVAFYHNNIDIFAALSLQESFGVAVVEAGATETPVVVSDAGGLPEVVEDGVSGLVVPKANAHAAFLAMEKLVLDPGARLAMGKKARERAARYYNWDFNVIQMIDIYKEVLHGEKYD